MTRIPFLILISLAMVTFAKAGVPAECFQFEQHPIAEPFRGPFAKPNVSSPAQVHRFRTVIRKGSEGEPDFAGRFRVVQWGCGSNCHAFALVDKKTGAVYTVPVVAALGASYRLNSGLFVIDPPEMIEENNSTLFKSMSFAWDETSHSLIPVPACDGYAQPGAPEGRSAGKPAPRP